MTLTSSQLQQIKMKYGVIGNTDGLNRALDIALQVAPTDLSVLVVGESGVGKEIFPRIIHDNSLRKHKRYFAVNCGSIPEGTIDSELFGHEKGSFTGAIGESAGYFGSADGGTLFLDEVGELPLSTQARLLRVLETGEYIRVGSSQVRKTNVRIVAATNVNMTEAVKNGKFREDLYYRLNTIPIHVPPLRERPQDIPLLFRKFANEISEKYNMPPVRLDEDAVSLLTSYAWPGNIRQLKNITEQISVLEEQRHITGDIMRKYVPLQEESTQLVSLRPLQGARREDTSGGHTENERMLYKILFELQKEVNDLKAIVNERMIDSHSDRQMIDHSHPMIIPADGYKTQKPLYPNHMQPGSVPYVEPKGTRDEYVEETLSLEDMEKRMIEKALEKNNGRRKDAALDLDISERTLYRKIKQYGLENK